ncbi:tetratricopeptide repeat protein [Nocardia sp. BMG51109]|uniref:ATP-binding protein n=1 Tax=Nocardia sp. BMG51109 TaxID=1056816 RepID=UPI000464189D|nr:tetratricopeptide repeat protein [Nocardia sp. BMG51109]
MSDKGSRSCDPGCARRIRDSLVHRPGGAEKLPADDPPADLLHTVAEEIAVHCGHTMIKASRLARGWTVAEAVEEFHRMCRRENLGPRGLVSRSWMEWEAGSRPSWDYQDLLSRLFRTNPVHLGWAPDYAPPARAAAPAQDRSAGRAPRHLPPDTSDFTGRDDQVAELVDLLGRTPGTAVPLAAVSGKPGVGKTALAVHVGHRLRDVFHEGQLYANLRGTDADPADAGEILAGFLRELGVESAAIPGDTEERARMYRTRLSGRRVLVVLDNAADETQLRPLLPGTAGCAVLATSRTPLAALPGTHRTLDVLPDGQAVELLTTLIGYRRARAESSAVREVVRLCGALPLALRIAGARLLSRPGWSVSWFADRLTDESHRLDLLTAGDLEVRASFALGYRSRNEGERAAFRMLALTASSFPAWNLAALLDIDPHRAEHLLEGLVDAQLVEPAGADATGMPRYRLHDLVRDFARECSAADDPPEVRRAAARRLVDEYLGAVRVASATLSGGTDEAYPSIHAYKAYPSIDADGAHPFGGADMARPFGGANGAQPFGGAANPAALARAHPHRWLAAEQRNLLAAVELAHDLGLWSRTRQLAATLPVLVGPAGATHPAATGQAHTEQAHTEQAHTEQAHTEAAALRSLGTLHRRLGRFDDAAAMLTGAAEVFRHLDEDRQWATAMRSLGDTRRCQGRLDEAVDAFSTALPIARRERNPRLVAKVLNGLGDADRGLSRWDDATRCFEESLAIHRELGDRLGEARTLLRFGQVHRDRWDNDRATRMFEDALGVFTDLDDQRWQARALRQIAVVHRNEGADGRAFETFEQALALFDRLGDRRGTAVTLRNRGDAHRLAGHESRAASDIERAQRLFESLDDRRWVARCLLSLADLDRAGERYGPAQDRVDAALDIVFRTRGDRPARGRALRQLGLLARDRGDFVAAAAALAHAHTLFADLGDTLWIARVQAGQARLTERRGEDPAPELKEAIEICHRHGIGEPGRVERVLREW